MKRSILAIALAAVAISVPVTAGASAPSRVPLPAYPGPTLPTLTPPSIVIPGGQFLLQGENFEPGCPYEVYFVIGTLSKVFDGTVDGGGEISALIIAPSGTTFRQYPTGIPIQVNTASPCVPESAQTILVAELPPTL